MPSMSAPSVTRKRQRSCTCGSQAAFRSVVSPSARARRHDGVLRPGDACLVEEQRRALETLGAHLVPLTGLDVRAERGERVNVRVDPAAANHVPSGRRHRCGAEAGEQRPGEQDRRADLVAELLVELRRRHARRVDANVVRPHPIGVRARAAHEREHRVHVEDPRDVSELDRLVREQRCGENRQRGVLVPGRLHAPGEGVPSLDHERLSQGVGNDGLHGDGSLPIHMDPTREQAWETLTKYTKAEPLLRHALAVEASVGWYARHFGEDEEQWRVVALLHDFDYEIHPTLDKHPQDGAPILREEGYPEDVIEAVLSHAEHLEMPRDTQLKKTLFACDELSGFVTACGYVRPDGIATLEPKSVRKKLKQPSFAAGVHRDEVYRGAEELGLELDEHIANVIEALRPIADQLGLKTALADAELDRRVVREHAAVDRAALDGPHGERRRRCAAHEDVVDHRAGRREAGCGQLRDRRRSRR